MNPLDDVGLIALFLGVPMLITGVLVARHVLPSTLDFVLDIDVPDAWVVYSFGSLGVRTDARRARARRRGLGKNEVFAVLVRPDRYEIWGRKDTKPRWEIDRHRAEIDTILVLVRYTYAWGGPLPRPEYERGIHITDGERSVNIVPAGGSVDSALRALHR
ncbi:MAG: hypothetical protein ACRDPS_24810 [Nocardioides sp.]|uniref:hypothetical protein n=1 Tax=Nocardioides sp. TaxID=35761 RepID=UPI003D6B6BAC